MGRIRGGVDLSNSNRKLGLMPGSIVYTGENPNYNITITVIYYSKDFHKRETFSSTEKIDIDLKFKGNIWINIDGINDVNLIRDTGEIFDIDALSLEDIVNPEQRVKIDDRDRYILIILKMLQLEVLTKDVQYEQLSIIIKKNILITFQETPYDPFEIIRARLETPGARLRSQDVSYLAYILIDVIVDNYLLILDEVENEIDEIENQLIESADKDDLENILALKDETEKALIFDQDIIVKGVNGKSIKAKTTNLKRLVQQVEKKDMVFAIGPAGTGKTYTSVALAAKALRDKEVKRIILTRPAVEAGENLGFLPGDLKEKLDPYLQPLYDALRDMIPHEKLESFIEKRIIEVAPLAFMRGRTLDDAFVILDEAQNTTHAQMKMFLTRMGMNAKFIITGDPSQVDLPLKQKSGLKEAIRILDGIEEIGFVYLTAEDVVRHPVVKKIINAYSEEEKRQREAEE